MQLLRLSDEIGSDAVKNVNKLIHTVTFKPDVFIKHINDWKGYMEIIDG